MTTLSIDQAALRSTLEVTRNTVSLALDCFAEGRPQDAALTLIAIMADLGAPLSAEAAERVLTPVAGRQGAAAMIAAAREEGAISEEGEAS